jgi:hypothetical protein
MGDFVYTGVPGKLKLLLGKIRTVGVPPKVTVQWLKTIGFTSSNDSTLIGVLRFVGLIDSNNVPTSKWIQFRGANHKLVLGEAIRDGYSELFAVYPDAEKRTQADLDHVFSTSSTGGKQVISKTIATFKALADEAEFLEEAATQFLTTPGPLHTPVAPGPNGSPAEISRSGSLPFGPALHIDIQIHISPEASAAQIEQIFASMAKHVYGRSTAE